MRHAPTIALTLAAVLLAAGPAPALTLATAPGDGQVSVGLDGFGSFGYEVAGTGTDDAVFDPLGATGPSSTSWESAVYFRMSGMSKFLTSGLVGTNGQSGQLTDPGFSASTATTASSSFTYAGLQFILEQQLVDGIDMSVRSGSVLIQTYTITNPGPGTVSFDLVRYYEGDLKFANGTPDGGGHIFAGPTEYVFETDTASDPATSVNFVGITATGGTIPTSGRYEVNQWPAFPARITADMPLGDVVFGDGADADEFVDAGHDYDAGIALANQFSLGPGEHVDYVTTTRFGTGAPADVPATSTTTTTSPSTTTTLPTGCPQAPTFASILCLLDELAADVQNASDLGRLKNGLANALAKAKKQAQKAASAGTGKVAKTQAKKTAKTLGSFEHKLASRSARKIIPQATRDALRSASALIRSELDTLRGSL